MKPIKLVNKWIAAFCMLSLMVTLQGCVQDDLSDCGIGVQFRYIKNVEGVDKFAAAVDKISLFVFDEKGTYLGEYSDQGDILTDNYIMNISLRAGIYQLVAWGNLCDDYLLTPFTIGVTQIEEVLLSLKNTEYTVENHPTHLFYGGINTIEITSDYTGRKHVLMDMMKNTNSIHVTAYGLPLEITSKSASRSGTTFDCTITSRNGDYKFDNSITGERLTYIPGYGTEGQVLLSEFVIMRELNDGSTGSRLIVTHHKGSGEEESKSGEAEETVELLNVSLTDLLVPASITGDLDIDDDFNIELIFDYTNSTATIIVNGWVINETPVVVG
ncbi:hypothetical protein M2459_003123 [Parabacteroides sp. PF5-5]|uniref:FimB/Mfa2 family fimbrial subunit n=1 Tax=unclassified Parabacteroides TaxID=2649774 RepID=UPI002475BC48|nr:MULTISPECIES: FimB/Mfa2 family fimbrial subunit [unclassified Parabacteroides]MDH6307066.1 hypothetical protein [Parabacteroides sp. PH5-39]MDH6317274.1 hypothetical protein [Parabacteroides sp. PF5-13]MDH6321722.1 hypothetical protein [Parabacteroides sp. PH5-13]MDH6325454.1 hypothetical protein [Parabacteroides sp. PH5-8]MDH6328552.1 hypothetical protein [Parabacteroides sp. PH5-41]